MTWPVLRRALLTSLLIATLAGPADAEPAAAGAIRAAIDGGRLLQARTMLDHNRELGTPAIGQGGLEADLLMAEHRYSEALGRYLRLIGDTPGNAHFLTGAGLAALRLGDKAGSVQYLRRAVALEGADWTAWNALGVLSDGQGAWADSAMAYDKAFALAPDKAAIWNNRGYSLLLQRRPQEALAALDRAAALDPNSRCIAVNRQMARGMAGLYPRARGEHESSRDWAARLNNAGYGAWLAGDRPAARSLLARAIEASEVHYGRALANLALVEGKGAQ
ncbi:tetratricopeptide repeat protein [Allosphingosinicella humi]